MSKAEDIAEKKQKVIEYFRTFPVYKHAANSVGISEDTLMNWRKGDEEFSANLNQAASEFFSMQTSKARPEFILERLDRTTFAPPAQKVEHSGGVDPVRLLLEKYGLMEGEKDVRKSDESAEDTRKGTA